METRRRRTPLSEQDNEYAIGRVRELMGSTSQLALSKAMGYAIPQGRLSDILNGRVRFTEDTLGKVAKVLDVAPSALLPPRGNAETPKTRAMSEQGSRVAPTPIPAALRSFLDARPSLHPAVKWELEQNHDQRTPEYVVKDDRFWDRLAHAWADILGIAGGPYQERGADGGEAPRPRKDRAP